MKYEIERKSELLSGSVILEFDKESLLESMVNSGMNIDELESREINSINVGIFASINTSDLSDLSGLDRNIFQAANEYMSEILKGMSGSNIPVVFPLILKNENNSKFEKYDKIKINDINSNSLIAAINQYFVQYESESVFTPIDTSSVTADTYKGENFVDYTITTYVNNMLTAVETGKEELADDFAKSLLEFGGSKYEPFMETIIAVTINDSDDYPKKPFIKDVLDIVDTIREQKFEEVGSKLYNLESSPFAKYLPKK